MDCLVGRWIIQKYTSHIHIQKWKWKHVSGSQTTEKHSFTLSMWSLLFYSFTSEERESICVFCMLVIHTDTIVKVNVETELLHRTLGVKSKDVFFFLFLGFLLRLVFGRDRKFLLVFSWGENFVYGRTLFSCSTLF